MPWRLYRLPLRPSETSLRCRQAPVPLPLLLLEINFLKFRCAFKKISCFSLVGWAFSVYDVDSGADEEEGDQSVQAECLVAFVKKEG